MFRFFLLSCFICVIAAAVQKQASLIVYKNPSYQVYDYSNKQPLGVSELSDLILTENGFSVNKALAWKGLKSKNSLEFPRLTVVFLTKNTDLTTDSYNTKNRIDIQEDADFDFERIALVTSGSDSFVKLNSKLPTDDDFKELKDQCSEKATSIVVYGLSDNESEKLPSLIEGLKKNFENNCGGENDLVMYVVSTNSKNRVKREAEPTTTHAGVNKTIENEALFYSDQYPAMFNLLFWTSLILGLAIFGISYAMWNMDPGLDTVIYRMTSQRIKKEQ